MPFVQRRQRALRQPVTVAAGRVQQGMGHDHRFAALRRRFQPEAGDGAQSRRRAFEQAGVHPGVLPAQLRVGDHRRRVVDQNIGQGDGRRDDTAAVAGEHLERVAPTAQVGQRHARLPGALPVGRDRGGQLTSHAARATRLQGLRLDPDGVDRLQPRRRGAGLDVEPLVVLAQLGAVNHRRQVVEQVRAQGEGCGGVAGRVPGMDVELIGAGGHAGQIDPRLPLRRLARGGQLGRRDRLPLIPGADQLDPDRVHAPFPIAGVFGDQRLHPLMIRGQGGVGDDRRLGVAQIGHRVRGGGIAGRVGGIQRQGKAAAGQFA